MAKNFRSKKKAAINSDEMAAEKELDDLRSLIKSLNEKIDKLDADSKRRHETLLSKLVNLDERTVGLVNEVKELKVGSEFTNKEVDSLKISVEEKAPKDHVSELRRKTEDLENRSKRNNVVLWNIPEGTVKDSTCQDLVVESSNRWKVGYKKIKYLRGFFDCLLRL